MIKKKKQKDAAEVNTKELSIDKILARIEKRHGDGVIRILGDAKVARVDVIPTGSYLIDKALVIGGFPKGRIVECYGAEGGGKCITADALCLCKDGLLTVSEIFRKNKLIASCASRTTKKEEILINRHGSPEATTAFTNNSARNVIKITTHTGNEITCTDNHAHLVMSSIGNWVWKNSANIHVGDYVCLYRDMCKGIGSTDLNLDTAYFLGLLIADGHIAPTRFSITNNDPYIVEFLRNVVPSIVNITPSEHVDSRSKSIVFHFSSVGSAPKFYKKYNIKVANSPAKELSDTMRSLKFESMRSLLQGYVDCECFVNTQKPEIEIVSASYTLIYQVKLILQQVFGIISQLKPKHVRSYPNNKYWKLMITGEDCRSYIKCIGTRSALRQSEFNKIAKVKNNTNKDSIPNVGLLLSDLYNAAETTIDHWKMLQDYMGESPRARLTYNRLYDILYKLDWPDGLLLARLKEIEDASYFYDKVVRVEPAGKRPTFDFAMQTTHSFIANGIVTHNTSLTLQTIANAQSAGDLAAFIDAEHSLDLRMARNMGVNIKKLVLSQPDYGEQALEIVEALVDSHKFGIIVVDSVAALIPKAELDGEMTDQQVGLQARMMGKALRKLIGKVAGSNCCLIFINQLRSKIGGMSWGDPDVTPGGRALKFYSSIRLDIRRKSSLKRGENIVGNRVIIKVVKNKLAPPFRTTETDFIFGRGFDRIGEVIEIAEKLDVLDRSGSWYVYGKEKIGQGKQATREFLSAHPEVLKDIKAAIKAATAKGKVPSED